MSTFMVKRLLNIKLTILLFTLIYENLVFLALKKQATASNYEFSNPELFLISLCILCKTSHNGGH